jgi:hypothetical protein
MTKVRAGEYYRETARGLEPTAPGTPDAIICRRRVDFPEGRVPAGAAIRPCAQCREPIVYNSARRYTAPLICMQCADITPDPLSA